MVDGQRRAPAHTKRDAGTRRPRDPRKTRRRARAPRPGPPRNAFGESRPPIHTVAHNRSTERRPPPDRQNRRGALAPIRRVQSPRRRLSLARIKSGSGRASPPPRARREKKVQRSVENDRGALPRGTVAPVVVGGVDGSTACPHQLGQNPTGREPNSVGEMALTEHAGNSAGSIRAIVRDSTPSRRRPDVAGVVMSEESLDT